VAAAVVVVVVVVVVVAASSAVGAVAAAKAKNRFPLAITPLWLPRRSCGAPGPRGAYPAEVSE
jgi:hypothetical protein